MHIMYALFFLEAVMEYTTQMDAARKGIFTKEMEAVCAKERMSKEELMGLMSQGKVIIPCNKLHK